MTDEARNTLCIISDRFQRAVCAPRMRRGSAGKRNRALISIPIYLVCLALGATLAPAQPAPPPTRLLQVIMIEANVEGSMPAQGIPRAAMQSLADMKDILPYKGFRLLDTALLRTAMNARATLKGPGGRACTVDLSLDQQRRPEDENSGGAEGPDLFFRNFSVRYADADPIPAAPAGGSGTGEAPAPSAPRTLISTSFGMDVGETLIVGSSRLNGDQTALILLVTALP